MNEIFNFLGQSWIYVSYIISSFAILYILLNYRYRYSAHIWIFLLLVFPVIGVIIFLIFGRDWKMLRGDFDVKDSRYYHKLYKNLSNEHFNEAKIDLLENNSHYAKVIDLSKKSKISNFTADNNVQLMHNGKYNFENIFADIKSAKKYIYMQSYIWRNDALTKKLHELLIEKAREGVEIKIIYDYIGSFFVNKNFLNNLRKNGVKIISNLRLADFWKLHLFNHRDHRKIIVIDDNIAYIGGMNMGQEYIDGGKSFKLWRDLNIKISGSSVKFLKILFATNWYFYKRKKLKSDINITENIHSFNPKNKVPVLLTNYGPNMPWETIKQILLTVISGSSKYIYIQSPYFIPDSSIVDLLCIASLRGVDVRIMITGIPDKKIPYWAAFSFMEPLLHSGIKIYLYKGGFLHSKMLVSDDEVSIIGSANIDIRSFRLNYELSSVIFDNTITNQCKEMFTYDMESCESYTLDHYDKESVFIKLRNSVCSLLYPVL